MNFTVETTGSLAFSGTLSIEVAGALREAILERIRTQPAIDIQLAAVEASDTCSLQILLAANKAALAASKSFRLESISQPVIDTAIALGLIDEIESLRPQENDK